MEPVDASQDPHFAVVAESGGPGAGSMYVVESPDGALHKVQRQHLRHRKWHTVAFCGVTGDQKQDAYATQHFVTKENQWWEANYISTSKEPISRSYTHSDNAYHFKSAKQMNYLSRVQGLFGWLVPVLWSFGCGEHGKGIWDGIGGMFKRALRQDTIDGDIKSASGDSVLATK